MGLPRREKGFVAGSTMMAAGVFSEVQADVPCLQEFLARQMWEDGTSRERGTLMIVAQDGFWKGWLNDKEGHCQCWVSAETFTDLLHLIEDGLEKDTLPWRLEKNFNRKK